ncbi:MAG: hypothetical protein Q7J27_14640 [Syntrophales bacterium]|nr:hypothetical protein [Syntrophales bacterium]
MRNVVISPALNGWKVQIGCGEVVFVDKEFMLEELSRYIDTPDKVEKEYQGNAVNETEGGQGEEIR